jgi:hypothetical protein
LQFAQATAHVIAVRSVGMSWFSVNRKEAVSR